MGILVKLTLLASLLLGTCPCAPAEPATKAQKDVENATVLILETATITITPGTKINIRQVKTEQGKRIRLEMPGMAIEAVRLRTISNGKIIEMKIGVGDVFEVRVQEGAR